MGRLCARLNETSHTDALDVWSAPVIQGDSVELHFSKRHSDMKSVESQHFQSISLF